MRTRPSICVVVPLTRPQFVDRIVEMWRSQTYPCQLVLLCNGPGLAYAGPAPKGVEVLRDVDARDKEGALNGLHAAAPFYGDVICIWDDDDLYGPRYVEVVAAHSSHAVTGLREYALWEDGHERSIRLPGFQGGTLAYRTDLALPPFPENIGLCAELVWRNWLSQEGVQIVERPGGNYTYCRYSDPAHNHVSTFDLHAHGVGVEVRR